jgi:LmbE family N-acetylglucosaminyl deacetylase
MDKVLVIAPHADDETLGMGATIAKLARRGVKVTVAVMTGHGPGKHPLWPKETWEKIRSEAQAATAILGVDKLRFFDLPAAMLSGVASHEINGAVQSLVSEEQPSALYLPFYHDLHFDHRLLCYAGLVATRPYLAGAQLSEVRMYETVSETHLYPASIAPQFTPNLFEDASDTFSLKLKAWECYKSQQISGITPRSAAALQALASWRGSQIGVPAAEAFMLIWRKNS